MFIVLVLFGELFAGNNIISKQSIRSTPETVQSVWSTEAWVALGIIFAMMLTVIAIGAIGILRQERRGES